jgi:hypothetical protein
MSSSSMYLSIPRWKMFTKLSGTTDFSSKPANKKSSDSKPSPTTLFRITVSVTPLVSSIPTFPSGLSSRTPKHKDSTSTKLLNALQRADSAKCILSGPYIQENFLQQNLWTSLKFRQKTKRYWFWTRKKWINKQITNFWSKCTNSSRHNTFTSS